MMTEPLPIQRRKLSHEVRERLQAMIEGGELRPGDPLPSERELMRLYQVGRPAIREAMQALERTGLVAIRHGERARVAEPSLGPLVDQLGDGIRHVLLHSPATLEHLKEARLAFELQMARSAAAKRSVGDVRRLRRRVEEQAATRAAPERFLEADGAFHREIATVSGNPIFAAVSEAMFRWLMHFHLSMFRPPGLEQVTPDEHAAIVDAIEAGDGERAAKAMADHLNRANQLYRRDNYTPPG
jgi:GntR family transcriptional regulator, sialic acid-inducible nan operon repressor